MTLSAMRVDFLIAGVQRGGTSSLDAWLRQHKAVCMSTRKEAHYFDYPEYFMDDPPDYEVYHGVFDVRPGHSRLGEATPIYVYLPGAVRRIWQYNPGMRLIVLLRNPIERAWSHWRLERSREAEPLDFSTAIRSERVRCRAALPSRHRVFSYTDRGFYSEQIRRLRRFFPDNQLLFLKSEALFADPQAALGRVCDFLGLEHMQFDTSQAHRQGADLGVMAAADRDYLRSLFRHDIADVAFQLGWGCADWLD